jgi:beta-lactamase regulating signal transducer with metallopeptidase domain
MSLELLIGLAWKSAACAGATLLALRLLRGRSGAERSQAAHLGMLVTLAAPFAALLLPPVPRPAAMPTPPLSQVLASRASESAVLAASPGAGDPSGAGSVMAALDFGTLAGWVYAVPAAVLALALLWSVLQLQGLRARARMVTDPAWLTALASTQQRSGFKQGTALLVSPEIGSPVSWGLLRPVVIVDERTSAEPGKADAIIAHELAHLARLDWAKLLLGGAATAVFWFNPLVWMLARRCHDLREEAADDAVLRGDIRPVDYAELLVGCADREASPLLVANGVAPSRGSVARRIGRVLDPSLRRSPAKAAWSLACCTAALVFAAPLALTFAPETGVGVSRAMAAETAAGAPAPAPGPEPAAAPRGSSDPARPLLGAGDETRPRRLAAITDEGRASVPEPAPAPAPVLAPALGEALVIAAGRGDRTGVDQLLRAGADPNTASPGDGSPLIQAARTGPHRDGAHAARARSRHRHGGLRGRQSADRGGGGGAGRHGSSAAGFRRRHRGLHRQRRERADPGQRPRP